MYRNFNVERHVIPNGVRNPPRADACGVSAKVINAAEIPSTSSGQALRFAQDGRIVVPIALRASWA